MKSKVNKKLVDAVVKLFNKDLILSSCMYNAAFNALDEFIDKSLWNQMAVDLTYMKLVQEYSESAIVKLKGVPGRTIYQSVSSVKDVVASAIAFVDKDIPSLDIICKNSVRVLNLSPRACNVLLRGGIETIGQLYTVVSTRGLGSWGECYRNCGVKTMREVEEALFGTFPVLASKEDRAAMSVSNVLAEIEKRVDTASDLGVLHEILTDIISVSISLTSFKHNMEIEREAIHCLLDYYRENAFKSTEEDNLAALEVFSNI